MNLLAVKIVEFFSLNQNKIFLESIDLERTLTYQQVYRRITKYIIWLKHKGIKKQEIVTVVFENNSEDIICLLLALIMMDVVSCPIRTNAFHLNKEELGTNWVVFDDSYEDINEEAKTYDIDSLHLVSTGKVAVERELNGNPVLILPSSGTTGECKWIVLSDHNFIYVVDEIRRYMHTHTEDIFMAVKHLSHVSTFTSDLLLAIFSGAKFVIYHDKFIPKRINRYIQKFNVTVITMVPTILTLLLSYQPEETLVSLRKISLVGGAASSNLITDVRRILPDVEVYIGYGLTEASSRVTYLSPKELDIRPGSIGKTIPGTNISLVNHGKVVTCVNEIGEIVVNGDGVMLGYLKKGILNHAPKELYTNDLAYRDSDGYYYHAGRKDDIININGNKISSIFIEKTLENMEKVEAAFVFQIKENSGVDIVAAVIVSMQDSELKKEDVFRYAQQKIDLRFIPKKIWITDKIPTESSGKVSRRRLSELFI